MRITFPILAFASLGVSLSNALVSWPDKLVDLAPLNYPPGALNTLLQKRDFQFNAECPFQPNSCGVVTFKGGMYTNFGQGTCMQLGPNVDSIYVSKCFCSLWNSCEGDSKKDVYVDGMMMCQKPMKMDEFDKDVKYISCGGMR